MANGKTAAQVIKAIKDSNGYIAKAAALLGVARSTLYNYLKKYPTAQDALEDVRQTRHEYVESKLMKHIHNDNLTAIIFYLKTQCGWKETQRTELTGAGGDSVVIKVNWDDSSSD
jgi:hypothetical protein